MDGKITPTSEATLPLPDDGLYRGDGVFEVARLYAGRPFAMDEHWDRLERSAATIGLPVDRAALEAELPPLLAEAGEVEANLRVVVTRGGRRILLIEEPFPYADSASVATVTYQPTVILNVVKSLSLRGQHARHPHRQGARRRRGDLRDARRRRPGGADLVGLLGGPGRRPQDPSLDNPILDSITRDRVDPRDRGRGGHVRPRRLPGGHGGVHGLDRPRGPAALGDRRLGARWPGPHTIAAMDAFKSAIETELGISLAGGAP